MKLRPLDTERLTVNTDTSVDTGEYFFNLSCSSWPDLDGVSRFNNSLLFVRFGKFWSSFFMSHFWGICTLLDVSFPYFADGLNSLATWENIPHGTLPVTLLLSLSFSS